jgi:hypothetical protein
MITNQQKTALLKTKTQNQFLSEFSPDNFYSFKEFNPKLTNNNKVQKMNNLQRNFENEITNYHYSKKFDFNLNIITDYLRNENYVKCFELIRFYFETTFNNIEKNSVYKSKYNNNNNNNSSLLTKINNLFSDDIITYPVYYLSLKIIEIIDKKDDFYLAEENLFKYNNYSTTELVYRESSSLLASASQNKSEISKLTSQLVDTFMQLVNNL